MHELSIAASLVQMVEEQARAHGLSRVVRVSMAVGDLVVVEGEALRFGFEVAARSTVADGAELVMQKVSGDALRLTTLEGS